MRKSVNGVVNVAQLPKGRELKNIHLPDMVPLKTTGITSCWERKGVKGLTNRTRAEGITGLLECDMEPRT